MKYFTTALLAVSIAMMLAMPASGTLYDRGNGLIYDNERNITWMQEANLTPLGQAFDWYEAMDWAATLEYGGFFGWEAASIDELRYMYDHYLGPGTYPPNKTGDKLALGGVMLYDIQPFYWSSTSANRDYLAWVRSFEFDFESATHKISPRFGAPWAVHRGDVAAVPEPGGSRCC